MLPPQGRALPQQTHCYVIDDWKPDSGPTRQADTGEGCLSLVPRSVTGSQSCRWHVAVDILLAVRRLVVQGGSTALEHLTKKPGFFC
jgi:hypothetical protein